MSECVWERRTWKEIYDEVQLGRGKSVALLPVGSVEQHGPHLPLGLDTMIADYVCLKSCERLRADGIIAYKLPPIWYGLSSMWLAYAGTLTVKPSTLSNLIKDIAESLLNVGVKHLVIVNGHAGNSDQLRITAREVCEYLNFPSLTVITLWDLVSDVIAGKFSTPFFHAGEVETSIALAMKLIDEAPRTRGENISKFRRYYSDFWHSLDLRYRPKVYVYVREGGKRVGSGSFGRPDLASEDKGHYVLAEMINRLTKFIAEVLLSGESD